MLIKYYMIGVVLFFDDTSIVSVLHGGTEAPLRIKVLEFVVSSGFILVDKQTFSTVAEINILGI